MDPADRRSAMWLLIGLAVWVATAPGLAALARGPAAALVAIAAWMILPGVYAFVARDPRGIGLTLDHLGPALADACVLTGLVSVLRVGVIALFPAVAAQVAGGPLEVAEALRTVEFGTWRGPRPATFVLTFAVALAGAAGAELFYRGFLFNRIQRSTHWLVALAASALLFGGYHYFLAGPLAFASAAVVSLASGWLMARYGNLAGPVLFHYLQYAVAVLVFYFVPRLLLP